jgi:hypothetical protein
MCHLAPPSGWPPGTRQVLSWTDDPEIRWRTDPLFGSVQNAAPAGVLPQGLCTAFMEESAYVELQNQYHDDTVHRSKLAETPRRTFRLTRRLGAAQLAALASFFDAHGGGMVPFYFYNPWEATPVGSNWSADGSTLTGRYTVVFRGDWQQTTGLARTDVPQLQLVEVA